VRIHYLVKALDNLLKGESIVQSITIAQSIISEYSSYEYQDQAALSQIAIITQLNRQLQLVDVMIQNIVAYHN
jgi:hypothetical protein